MSNLPSGLQYHRLQTFYHNGEMTKPFEINTFKEWGTKHMGGFEVNIWDISYLILPLWLTNFRYQFKVFLYRSYLRDNHLLNITFGCLLACQKILTSLSIQTLHSLASFNCLFSSSNDSGLLTGLLSLCALTFELSCALSI